MPQILTGSTGFAVDCVTVGTSSFREITVIGGASSGLLAVVSSTAPSGSEIGLYVRPIGSSGVVLGSVAFSSNVTLASASGTVVGSVAPSSTWTITPSSGALVILSSGTAQIGGLGPSSANVIGSIAPSSNWTVTPTSGALMVLSSGLAQIGALGPSSGNVVGSVAPSSVWSMVLNASSATVIGSVAPSSVWSIAPTSQTIQLGTAGLLINSSANIWTQIGYSTSTGQGSTDLPIPVRLASPSSAIVIGSVAPSSIWTITPTTGALVILSSGTASIGVLGSASGTVIGAITQSSAFALSSGIASIGVLGSASGTVIGSVAPSSVWSVTPTSQSALIGSVQLTSQAITLGTLTTGTAVGLTTTNLIGLTTSLLNYVRPVAASTQGATPADFGLQMSGIVASTGIVAAQTSGNTQIIAVDPYGRLLVNLYAPFRNLRTANLVTAANTSQQQIIASQGTSAVAHITAITAWSSAGTTTLAGTVITIYSSCGQADPGRWRFPLSFVPSPLGSYTIDFVPPLTQPTAGNGWFVVSSSSGTTVQIQAQYFFTTT